jgi:hypothetical protein
MSLMLKQRRNRIPWRLIAALASTALLVSGLAGWFLVKLRKPERAHSSFQTLYPADNVPMRERFGGLLGLPADQVIQKMGLDKATAWFWVDEPPGYLRGVTYFLPGGQWLTLYVACGEPLYKNFSESDRWDYDVFLGAKVGGIQYWGLDNSVAVWAGSDVPFQWRPINQRGN